MWITDNDVSPVVSSRYLTLPRISPLFLVVTSRIALVLLLSLSERRDLEE